MIKLLLFFLFYFFSYFLNAQDSLSTKKVKILPVPAFGYSPETKTYIGAVVLFTLKLYDDNLTRSSNAKVEFNYTWNKQLITEASWNFFTKEEKWFTQGIIHYSKYPDSYFGIGSNRKKSDKVLFESNRVKIELNALKRLKSKWFFGIEGRHFNYYNVQNLNDTIQYLELKNGDRTGIGWSILFDNRNNILSPSEGVFFKITNTYNFGRTNYSHLSIDGRKYINLGKKNSHVFSSRIYTEHTFGNAPFYDLSLIGGDRLVRGYFYGRYRDNHLSTLQVQYQSILFWRIGFSAFGGTSLIYSSINSLNSDDFKPNAGVGLRFLIDKKENTHLRFDYAVGANGESGFYISFGESF